ncbi:peptidase family M49-domain-containing protein [Zopfochytrium polystomum]|nr:peptidase family M49-domain-containing protein [Zopfochytrium polystomum]
MPIDETTRLLHACDANLPLTRLVVKQHFDALSDDEKLYAHWIAKASWAGARVIAGQASHHSNSLVQMFLDVFSAPRNGADTTPPHIRDMEAYKAATGLSDAAWKQFLEYAVSVLYNLANYTAFGDAKFVPNCTPEEFDAAIKASESEKAAETWAELKDVIFSLDDPAKNFIGYPSEGHVTGYYRGDPTKEEIQKIQAFLDQKGIHTLNTRLTKKSPTEYTLHIASASTKAPKNQKETEFTMEDGTIVTLEYGDFSALMRKAALAIRRAMFCCANETQRKMVEAYAMSWETGEMELHKESQRLWIKDVGPVVESNVGFVETYKDPAGVRAEWEGFVAIVNKDQTAKFGALVDAAESFLALLPWPRAFEKDVFNRPDFTSLEVLSFCTGGSPPLGINIPNYDDIRQTLGFKNVSLGNVANAPKAENELIPFVAPEDLAMFEKLRGRAFEVQVGLHEMLGHGSGKLLTEREDGTFDFDRETTLDPRDGTPVKSWYKQGQTWNSVFGAAASSMEECRAELVALALMDNRDVLKIFEIEEDEAMDIVHTAYLTMVRAGLVALQVYDPKAKKWGQAHSQARFGIMQKLLASGAASIDEVKDAATGALDDLVIRVHRDLILTKGLPAVQTFLRDMQITKSTADAARGVPWYVEITSVSEKFEKYREVVVRKKQPRKVFVQGNTYIERGTAVLKEYPLTLEGFIESVIERDM